MSARSIMFASSLAAVMAAPIAFAEEADPISVDEAEESLRTVEVDLKKARDDLSVIAVGYGQPTPKTVQGRVERRLREGEINFLLNDYLRAAIILFDVVDNPENRSHPRYDDAVFFLAESLRQLRNNSEARKYFEELLPRAQGDRLKDVVLALLKIANDTRHYEDVERYIDQLSRAGAVTKPTVDYIHGKTIFQAANGDRSQLDRAYRTFKGVPAGSDVGAEAAYYAGVVQVQLGKYAEAVPEFTEAAQRAGKSAEGRAVREMAYLSLGRVHFELGDVAKAVDAYQEVGRTSPAFSEMLFEVAWAHVKAAKQSEDDAQRQTSLTRALRMAELLMASSPDSKLFPEARILEGNLQIKLGAPESAYDTFQSIVDGYGGARTQLATLIATNPDPRQFFDQLVAADMHNLTSTEILPPVAVTWAVDTTEMKQAVHVLGDMSTSEQYQREARELLDALSLAISGEQRYNLFTGIGDARAKAYGADNRLLLAERRLVNLEHKLMRPFLGPAELGSLDAHATRRRALEADMDALPQSGEQVEEAGRQIGEAYRAAERRSFRQSYQISSMRAQIVAIDVWLGDNRAGLSADQVEMIKKRLAEARAEVAELEKEQASIASEMRTYGAVSGGDAGRAHAAALRAAYAEMIAGEAALMRSQRGRLPVGLAGVPIKIDSNREEIARTHAELARLQQGLDEQIESKVAEVRDLIEVERRRLDGYQAEAEGLRTETDAMLGPVAIDTLRTVATQFKDIVLKADVGIIDVAWARKQGVTTKVAGLVRDQQARTQELEAEFSDVLEGN